MLFVSFYYCNMATFAQDDEASSGSSYFSKSLKIGGQFVYSLFQPAIEDGTKQVEKIREVGMQKYTSDHVKLAAINLCLTIKNDPLTVLNGLIDASLFAGYFGNSSELLTIASAMKLQSIKSIATIKLGKIEKNQEDNTLQLLASLGAFALACDNILGLSAKTEAKGPKCNLPVGPWDETCHKTAVEIYESTDFSVPLACKLETTCDKESPKSEGIHNVLYYHAKTVLNLYNRNGTLAQVGSGERIGLNKENMLQDISCSNLMKNYEDVFGRAPFTSFYESSDKNLYGTMLCKMMGIVLNDVFFATQRFEESKAFMKIVDEYLRGLQ